MPTIIDRGELVRRAIRHIDEILAAEPDRDFVSLLDEACMRFNLGPIDAEDIGRIFRKRQDRPYKMSQNQNYI